MMKENGSNSFSVPQGYVNLHPGVTGNYCGYIDMAGKMIKDLDPEVIQNIGHALGLSFVQEKEKESEVCFMNSEELRPEFRLSFAPVDVADYIYAVLQNISNNAYQEKSNKDLLLEIPYPKDAPDFWGLVKAGEGLRQGR
jgi:hypothetical protein